MDYEVNRPEPETPDAWGRVSPRDDEWKFFESEGFVHAAVGSDGWATSWKKGPLSIWKASPYEPTGVNWITCWTLDVPGSGLRVVGHLGPFSRETAVTRPQPDERAFTQPWDYWRGWLNAHRGASIIYPDYEGFNKERMQGWLDGKKAQRDMMIKGAFKQ